MNDKTRTTHLPETDIDSAEFDHLRRSLSGGAFEYFARRPSTAHVIMLVVAGLLLTVYLIRSAGDFGDLGTVLYEIRWRVLGFLLFTNAYVVLKGLALRQSATSCQVSTGAWSATRIFCESSLVGLVVAKIASDVYKYACLSKGTRANRIRAILVYRVASITAVLALSCIVSVVWADSVAWKSRLVWLVPAAVVGGLVFGFGGRLRRWAHEHGRIVAGVLPLSLGALAAKIAGLAMLLGVSIDGELVEVAAAFLVIGSLASMTQIPAGLGMVEAGYAVYLTKYAQATGAEVAAFLICFRLLGPAYTAALGLISMGSGYVERVRKVIRRNSELQAAPASNEAI